MDNGDRSYSNQQYPIPAYGGYSPYNSYDQGLPPQQWQSGPPNQGWQSYGNYSQVGSPQGYQRYQQPPAPYQYGNDSQDPPPTQRYQSFPAQNNCLGVPQISNLGGARDRGVLEHIPFTDQHAQHEAREHQHPLTALLSKKGTHIALNLSMLVRTLTS